MKFRNCMNNQHLFTSQLSWIHFHKLFCWCIFHLVWNYMLSRLRDSFEEYFRLWMSWYMQLHLLSFIWTLLKNQIQRVPEFAPTPTLSASKWSLCIIVAADRADRQYIAFRFLHFPGTIFTDTIVKLIIPVSAWTFGLGMFYSWGGSRRRLMTCVWKAWWVPCLFNDIGLMRICSLLMNLISKVSCCK